MGIDQPLPLFAAKNRTDGRTKRAAESDYQFLDRVADPAFERIRHVFNEWVERFARRQDRAATNDLVGRLRSKQPQQFYGAFWELYLHELHARLEFGITVHPRSQRGTKPDFVLERGADRLYLEAVVPLPSVGPAEESGSARTVTEYIDAAYHPDYWLALRWVAAGPDTPRKAEVIARVRRWLDSLTWQDMGGGGFAASQHPETELRFRGWVIGLRAIPRPPQRRGKRGSMIFVYPARTGYPDAVAPAILPLLDEKATKYGELDAPHVVAVWVMNVMAATGTASQVLFGAEVPTEPGQHPAALPTRTEDESLWAPRRKARRRTSAVLATHSFEFNYSAIARVFPRLWINPWADIPLTAELPVPSSSVSRDGSTVENQPPSTTPARFFDLPPDWPGRPFR